MQAIKLKLALAACLVSGLALAMPAMSQPVANQSDNPLEQNSVAALQQRVQPFLQSNDVLTQYHAQKAQMWLTYAANQHSEGSSTAAEQQAQAQALQLIEQLEQQQPVSTTTPVIQASKVMRRDLWVNAELLKQQAGFDCAATEIAQAEVMLVWAAAEHCELGWRHSRELFAAAERLIDKANYQAANCHATAQSLAAQPLPAWNKANYPSLEQLNGPEKGCHGVVGPWPLVSATTVAPVVSQPVNPVAEPATQDVLPNVVHFALDQASLSQASQQVLGDIATVLGKNSNYSLTLYGYTDARGSQAYNLDLSQRRAKTVENFLIQQGVDASRIATVAAGEQQLISDPKAVVGHALSRRVVLVYASPDGQEIKTTSQTSDLQPEH
ncbi:OmpA family protein [Alkanindiges illinoisensis]|uniref:OmpA family protein n=1 Tax=Alkanindiges illinoisensis TaxID=197183 RepID=UPI0006866E4F|nr:OmpA family protein [Alkanindiges illinoisensis]